jgi:hypothetical protein
MPAFINLLQDLLPVIKPVIEAITKLVGGIADIIGKQTAFRKSTNELTLQQIKEQKNQIRSELSGALTGGIVMIDPKRRAELEKRLKELEAQEQKLKGGNVETKNTDTKKSSGTSGGYAMGTDYVPRAGSYWVGERGPEIVNLPQGSQVIPNNKTASQPVININIENPYIIDDYGVTKLIDRIVGRLKLLGLNPQ